MKYLIASDIHGSAYYCQKLLDLYKREDANALALLGDILYHGPRNELPRDYNPKEVSFLLNEFAKQNRILCVRGNCDAEVDQMVLNFPILADYAVMDLGCHFTYLTHGHVMGEENPPKLQKGDILIQGHTHVPKHTLKDGVLFLNPGSISIPKSNSYNGCIIYTNAFLDSNEQKGLFQFVDLDGQEYNRITF